MVPACRWWSRGSCEATTRPPALRPARPGWWCPTTAAASSTRSWPPPTPWPRWWRRSGTGPRCTWTAGSAGAPTCSRPWPSGRGRCWSAARCCGGWPAAGGPGGNGSFPAWPASCAWPWPCAGPPGWGSSAPTWWQGPAQPGDEHVHQVGDPGATLGVAGGRQAQAVVGGGGHLAAEAAVAASAEGGREPLDAGRHRHVDVALAPDGEQRAGDPLKGRGRVVGVDAGKEARVPAPAVAAGGLVPKGVLVGQLLGHPLPEVVAAAQPGRPPVEE